MHAVHVHVPFPIERVSVRRRLTSDDPLPEDAAELPVAPIDEVLENGYYAAGYRAGYAQAMSEVVVARQAETRSTNEALRELTGVLPELISLAEENFPQLLLTALDRLFRAHRFTQDELASEIGSLLAEAAQAQKIVIEVAPPDLQAMERRIDKLGLSLQRGRLQWLPNAALEKGEYLLQTDLGAIDGRRHTKQAQVRLVLEP